MAGYSNREKAQAKARTRLVYAYKAEYQKHYHRFLKELTGLNVASRAQTRAKTELTIFHKQEYLLLLEEELEKLLSA